MRGMRSRVGTRMGGSFVGRELTCESERMRGGSGEGAKSIIIGLYTNKVRKLESYIRGAIEKIIIGH